MNIFIMRHGCAESLIVNDPQRVLTPVGELEARSMAPVLNSLCQSIDMVYVSSYMRAQQTLHNLKLGGLNVAGQETTDDLIPSGNPQVFKD